MDTAAIVLCGGHSRRMGRDKWSLPFGPATLLEHVVEAVRPAVGEIVVVAREGQEIASGDWTVARDPEEGLGPLAGLVAGLRATAAARVFLTACDAPFLTAPFVRRLLELADGHDLAVPFVDGYAMTTCAVYARTVLEEAEALLARGRLRPAFLIDRFDARRVAANELPAGDFFRNCNTPEDYEAALRDAGYAGYAE